MGNKSAIVTGMGILSSIGKNIIEFDKALFYQKSGLVNIDNKFLSVAGLIKEFELSKESILKEIPKELKDKTVRIIRRMPIAVQTAVIAVLQAWNQAELSKVDGEKISIVTAGSNLSQGYIFENFNKYVTAPEYISPLYAMQHFDTNYNGVISEILNIHGEGMTVGGASASGNVCLIQGLRMIMYGVTDVCICVAPMYNFSPVELSSFSNLDVFGDYSSFKDAAEASRPFDQNHKGFIPGQASACIILETKEHAKKRGKKVLAELVSGAIVLDGNRLANANENGELRAMQRALQFSGLELSEIDYVNAHGTSTPSGDEIEANAIARLLKEHRERVWVNSTKSLTGHCMYSAGILEAIACICQMNGNYIHGTRNLENPITAQLRFAKETIKEQNIRYAMSNSFGFGGINSTIILKAIHE